MGVKDALAGLGVFVQQPRIKRLRFLCGMDANFFIRHVRLQHSRPAIAKLTGRSFEASPRKFNIGEVRLAVFLVPTYPARRGFGEWDVVDKSAPPPQII